MTTPQRRVSWFGVALIVTGLLLIARRYYFFNLDTERIISLLLVFWGLFGVARGFARNAQGKIFWCSVLFLYGVYFFLRTMDRFEFHEGMVFPATFLIFGIAFFMAFLGNPKDWFYLVPAFFVGGAGALFILTDVGYLSGWEVWDVTSRFWPLALIVIGLALLFRKRHNGWQVPPPVNPQANV
ncbi:MAG TPA: DUF5668 domain-containing protein [Bacteroidota bacterium]|nr:DUF5668 domain-containing protein [Bacteroidota bacterium]